jgi:outer membrane protein assembly factor BamE (lipoprotein component of BamABCDE complex)
MKGTTKRIALLQPVDQQLFRMIRPRVLGRTGMNLLLVAALAIAATAGCTRIHTEKGIEPTWLEVDADTFRIGASTQSDVLATLGPPSQIIPYQDGSIFYYLHEEAVGTGVIFIVYNQGRLNTRYDRAIFFFDAAGVLQDYAFSDPPQPAK